MNKSDIQAEIQALYKEIEGLKKDLSNTKSVVFDLLEELKKTEIPYREEYTTASHIYCDKR